MEGAEELGMDGEDTVTGGRLTTGLGDVLQGRGAGSFSIRVRDVDADPPHRKGPVKFPSQGHQPYYGEAAKSTGGWELGLPTDGDSDRGIGV